MAPSASLIEIGAPPSPLSNGAIASETATQHYTKQERALYNTRKEETEKNLTSFFFFSTHLPAPCESEDGLNMFNLEKKIYIYKRQLKPSSLPFDTISIKCRVAVGCRLTSAWSLRWKVHTHTTRFFFAFFHLLLLVFFNFIFFPVLGFSRMLKGGEMRWKEVRHTRESWWPSGSRQSLPHF